MPLFLNGHDSGTDSWRYLPHMWPMYVSGLCKGISPRNKAWTMVRTYLHFRILKFPLRHRWPWQWPRLTQTARWPVTHGASPRESAETDRSDRNSFFYFAKFLQTVKCWVFGIKVKINGSITALQHFETIYDCSVSIQLFNGNQNG